MLRFASLPPGLAQASLKGYLSNVSIPSRVSSYIYKRSTPQNRGGTQSRGVICSASTNRPDCQRSRCRHQSTDPKNSEEPRPVRCCDILNITATSGGDPELSQKPGLLFGHHPYRFPKTSQLFPAPNPTPLAAPSIDRKSLLYIRKTPLCETEFRPGDTRQRATRPDPRKNARFPPRHSSANPCATIPKSRFAKRNRPRHDHDRHPARIGPDLVSKSRRKPLCPIREEPFCETETQPPRRQGFSHRHRPPGPHRPPSRTRSPRRIHRQIHDIQDLATTSTGLTPLLDEVARCTSCAPSVLQTRCHH